MKNSIILLASLLLVISTGTSSFAQTANTQENEALLLHNKYEFEKALNIYKQVLEQCTDSLKRIELENTIIQSENGLSLLQFAFEPNVVAKETVSKKDFFLNYPGLANGSWIPLPKQFAIDTLSIDAGEFPVMYMPTGAKELYYSASDNSGSWNIYYSQLQGDTLWTAPQILNENVTSAGNELFPMLSANGKMLYFASNGHYGVGGYDLYVSEWDEDLNDWGIPQNLGFPYSSPKDDLFFYNTPDGLYSVFSSNRDCDANSLIIYATAFENVPLKKEVSPEEALRISKLPLSGEDNEKEESSIAVNDRGNENEYSKYTVAVNRVRELQQKLTNTINSLAKNRELYNTLTNADDLKALEVKISEQEIETLSLQNETNIAVNALQVLEMEFLSKGIFIPQIDEESADNSEAAQPDAKFAFADMQMGKAPDNLRVEPPVPEVDLSFKITKEDAVVVDLEQFPSGLVYQIQLFTLSKQATVKALRGLSPVFERKSTSGRYTYFAGIFNTYSEVLSNLNKVRKSGFPSAMIAAFKDGKEILVRNARVLEKEIAESTVYQVTIAGYDVLPQELLTVIRATTEKDLAKTSDDGVLKYVIGPFGKEEDAQMLVTALKAISDKPIEIEQVK